MRENPGAIDREDLTPDAAGRFDELAADVEALLAGEIDSLEALLDGPMDDLAPDTPTRDLLDATADDGTELAELAELGAEAAGPAPVPRPGPAEIPRSRVAAPGPARHPVILSVLRGLDYPPRLLPPSSRVVRKWVTWSSILWVPIVWAIAVLIITR